MTKYVHFAVSRRTVVQALVCGLLVDRVAFGATTVCVACGAEISPHAYRDARGEGVYCPNCGIDLAQHGWRVDAAALREPWIERRTASAQRSWSFVQVPFPNGGLVMRTSKPTVVRAEISW